MLVLGVVVALVVIRWCIEWRLFPKLLNSHWKPVICVCSVDGRIGIVLHRDYHRATRRYWRKVRLLKWLSWKFQIGEKHYEWSPVIPSAQGLLLKVSPVFVLENRSNDVNLDNIVGGINSFQVIAARCYIEKATFEVPKPPFDCYEGCRLRRYLFGDYVCRDRRRYWLQC